MKKIGWFVSTKFCVFISFFCLIFIPSFVQADMRVIIIDKNSLTYKLGPSNYDNSPSNYNNSNSNFANSNSNFSNSPSNYHNSPSNYKNSHGTNRLRTNGGKSVGYFVYSNKGVLNIFSNSGKRFGYVPASGKTRSIFQSSNSKWCGTLVRSSGRRVVGLIKSCFFRLLSS